MGIDLNKPVKVYRNLTRNVWSVMQNGKVECHAKYLVLKNAEFIVSESGRQRVLRDKKKNVHAFIRGYLSSAIESNLHDDKGRYPYYNVTYNPYRYDSFVAVGNEEAGPYINYEIPMKRADWVDLMIESDEPMIVWNNK